METHQLRQILGEQRFLAGLSDEDQWKLAKIARSCDFAAGTEIFTEGSSTADLYIVRSGRVELCMNVPAQGCLPILTLEAGDLLGWSAALGKGEMTATATAVIDTQVIALGADELQQLCEDDHDIGYDIMRRVATALSRRLVATRLQVLDLFRQTMQHSPAIGTGS
jgi:CRP-like cAMP-binding protein